MMSVFDVSCRCTILFAKCLFRLTKVNTFTLPQVSSYLNVISMILTEGETKQLDCITQMLPIRDALDVISGKWKVVILTSIMQGNRRFGEIQRSIPEINPKVLSRELKDMEEHHLIRRTVHDDHPVLIEYVATDYSRSLKNVMMELHSWGVNHRKKILGKGGV